jgi:hypothetical protein
MKSLFIISAHANTIEKQKILLDCIHSIKSCGFDIMVVSHIVIPEHICKEVNYCVYDSDNTLNQKTGTYYWMTVGDMKVIIFTNKSHDFPVIKNFRNGLYLAKANGYEFFLRTEYDNIFSTTEVHKIVELKEQMLQQSKRLIFFHAENNSWDVDGIKLNGIYYETLLMGGMVDEFVEGIDRYFPKMLDEYNNLFGRIIHNRPGCLEHYLYDAFLYKNYKTVRVPTFVQNYFPESQINKLQYMAVSDCMILPRKSNGKYYLYTSTNDTKQNTFKIYVDDEFVTEYVLQNTGNISDSFNLYELSKYSNNIVIHIYKNDVLVQSIKTEYLETKLNEYWSNGHIENI